MKIGVEQNKYKKQNEGRPEGRCKRMVNDEEEEIARLSNSLSSSVHVGLLDSCSAKEMTRQKHFKLGAKPQWSAHADWPNMSDESSAIPIPPWRDKSPLANCDKKKVEGRMSEEPSRGVKQKFEGLYEALSKKHAVECARLIREYEEMTRLSGKEANKEDVSKDQGLHDKIEDILAFMKKMVGKSNLSRCEPRYEEMLTLLKEIVGMLWIKRTWEVLRLRKRMSLGLEKAERMMKKIRETKNMNSLDRK